MQLISLSNTNFRGQYLVKILVVIVLYYATAKLGDFLTFVKVFEHNEYPPYWPPSGVAFGLILIMGRSVWPGIAIASLSLTPEAYWFLQTNPRISDVFIISSLFTIGRVAEPIIGYYLVKRLCPDGEPFINPKASVIFILITLAISVIGAGASSTGIQLVNQKATEVYLTGMFGWYIDNVVGILLFTPALISFYNLMNTDPKKLKTVGQIILIITIICLIYISPLPALSHQRLFLNTLPFLVLPILLWLAFKYHLIVSSFTVIIISIIAIYITTKGMGPFYTTDGWQDSVWLLQSFLIVASVSTIISYAAANERRINKERLEEQSLLLMDSNQNLRHMLEDLTVTRSKAEESERLKSIFLANMSHEIRTPMNAIMGFSELLEKPDLDEAKRQKFTKLIRERSQDLLSIINDILETSKIEAGKMHLSEVDGNIDKLMERIVAEMKAEVHYLQKKMVEIRKNNFLQKSEYEVKLDFIKLSQVLNNLLANALKFTAVGIIELECRIESPFTFQFTIRDTGIGIPAEKIDLVFKPFRQADETIHEHYGGSGLGLSICKGLVELWGGKIWVESKVNEGSAFHFTIPFKYSEQKL